MLKGFLKKSGAILKRIFKISIKLFIAFLILSIFTTVLYIFINPPITPLMLIRYNQQKNNNDIAIIKKQWVDIEDISPYLITAVISTEDQNFLGHNGFDFKALQKAYDENKKGKRIRGGSTISQQVAKNVFLWPNKSYLRKGLEAYFTVLIELFWSKERIMEVYLNVIELGDGVYGAEMASQIYFEKSADNLNRSEASLIAAILPSPRKRKPNKPTKYLLKRKNWIINQMNRIGEIDFDKD